MTAAAVAQDGSIILAGSTAGDWNGSIVGTRDFAAVRLDVDGTELWRWQVRRVFSGAMCGATRFSSEIQF